MRHLVIAVALSLGVLAGCPKQPPPVAPSTLTPAGVVTAGKSAIEKWRQAYELRSLDTLGGLYAHDLDVVVVVEGTPYLGWSAVEAMLTDRLKAAGEIHIRLKDVSVISLGPEAAFVSASMSREIVAAGGSTAMTENGTVTFVLRVQNGAWVIGSEHFSYKRSS